MSESQVTEVVKNNIKFLRLKNNNNLSDLSYDTNIGYERLRSIVYRRAEIKVVEAVAIANNYCVDLNIFLTTKL